jgi:hypothetical protein
MRIAIPTAYEAVTVGQYIKWQGAKDDTERLMAAAGVSRKQAEAIRADTAQVILDAFALVLEDESSRHDRTIKIGGVQYGFIPSLDHLTFGEHVDLSEVYGLIFGEKKQWNRLPLLLSILYRPVTESINGKYRIEPYDGEVCQSRAHIFEALSMEVVAGALLFFSIISKEFRDGGRASSQEQMRMKERTLTTLKQQLQLIEEELRSSP